MACAAAFRAPRALVGVIIVVQHLLDGHCHGQPLAEFELWRVISQNDKNQLRWPPLPA
jgi:hypothetical protein